MLQAFSVRPGSCRRLKTIASEKGEADPGQVKGVIHISSKDFSVRPGSCRRLKNVASEKGEADPGQVKEVIHISSKDFHKTIRLFSQWDQDVISQFYYR